MHRHRLKALCLVLVFTLGWASRTDAFLGLGDIVFDPANYAQAIEQVIRLEEQTAQLIRSYDMLQNQYDQMLRNAQQVPVDMSSRYRAVVTHWRSSKATNTYGTTAAWTLAANTGESVAHAFSQSTEPMGVYGSALTRIPSDQLNAVKTAYGTVELTDGAAQQALKTIGQLRAHASTVGDAIQNLEDDSLASNPDMNTEVAVLNKVNAAGLIAVRTGQDTNQLLVALVEHNAIEAKRTRDAEARAINQHIRFMTDGQAALLAQTANASAAMTAWRMP